MKKFSLLLSFSLMGAVLSACSEKPLTVRHYTEIASPHTHAGEVSDDRNLAENNVPMTGTPDTPSANAVTGALAWKTPEGWGEQAGSGMRLATFAVSKDGQSGECTIVALGMESVEPVANLQRWIGQMGVEPPSTADLSAFVKTAPTVSLPGGQVAAIYDLTPYAPKGADSILASIVVIQQQVIFIKLTGPQALVASELDSFRQLTASLHE